jgi:hypothetical protein
VGSEASATSPARRGSSSPSSRRCGAASPSRGATRRWWRKARTVAAVSPRPARYLSSARSESNRLRCEAGDTPWLQESGLSRSTRPV